MIDDMLNQFERYIRPIKILSYKLNVKMISEYQCTLYSNSGIRILSGFEVLHSLNALTDWAKFHDDYLKYIIKILN